jgi:hypothetical protein
MSSQPSGPCSRWGPLPLPDQLYRSAEATAGKTVRLGVLTNISREGTPGPLPEVKVTVPPKHGTLAIRCGKAKAGPLARCPNLEPPVQGVFYQSQIRYSGPTT